MDVDASEVDELASYLAGANDRALRNIKVGIKRTALEVKDRWRAKASRTGLKRYAASIDFTIEEYSAFGGATVEAEIGPNLSRLRAGAAFGFVEEGGPGVRSSPQHAGRDALQEAQEDWERRVEIAGWEAMNDS